MSWSIKFIGTPENIVKALQQQSTILEGASKAEYDAVLPHMVAAVEQNRPAAQENMVLMLEANGHAYTNTAQAEYSRSQFSMQLTQTGGQLV